MENIILNEWKLVHRKYLDSPEGLFGAQCTNPFISIMETMLEDEWHIFCQEYMESIFPILFALLTNDLMQFIKCDNKIPTSEYGLCGDRLQSHQLMSCKPYLSCERSDLRVRSAANSASGATYLAKVSNCMLNIHPK